MARARTALYVADTENHAIRAIDLESGQVSTVAGTGTQGPKVRAGGPARATPLSSPWDLALSNRVCYVAMAGTHQIWALDLDRQWIAGFAGTGARACSMDPSTSRGSRSPAAWRWSTGTSMW